MSLRELSGHALHEERLSVFQELLCPGQYRLHLWRRHRCSRQLFDCERLQRDRRDGAQHRRIHDLRNRDPRAAHGVVQRIGRLGGARPAMGRCRFDDVPERLPGPSHQRRRWVAMSGNPVAGARFAEYKSTGPGADPSQRAAGSVQLTDAQAAEYTLPTIFGGWVPPFSQ